MSVIPRVLIFSAASTALLFSLAATAQPTAAPSSAKQEAASASAAASAQQGAAPAASATAAPPVAAVAKAKVDPIAKLKQELGATQTPKGLLVNLQTDALFDFNQAGMRMEAAPTLEKLADLVRRLRKPVQVSGHTDTKGNAEYNKELSQQRAIALKSALVQRGIRAATIHTAGHGQDKPMAPNTNPDGSDNVKGRDLNRRIEVLIPKA